MTIVNTHEVVNRASVTKETESSLMSMAESMKRMRYPTVTIVKYGGLSSRLVNS